jgi:NNP family nitrate/nitrite transporter-like MFS transporter
MELKGNPTKGLIGTTLGFFFGFAAVSLYGPTAIYFKESMGLTPALVGLLVAIPALSGSLLRIPFGAWVDTTGGKKPFSILMLLSVIGLGSVFTILYLDYPDNMGFQLYPLILFFGFLSGCGIATFSVGIGQTSYWFPQKEQGNALGVYAGIGNLAPGLFSLILPLVLERFGIISAYLAWWMFLIVGTVLFLMIGANAYYFQLIEKGMKKEKALEKSRELGQEIFPSGTVIDSLKKSAAKGSTWGLVVIYFTTFGGFIALTAWFPTYWGLFFKLSAVMAGTLTAIYSLLTSAIRVFGGKLSDKFGGEKVAIYSLMILLAGASIISISENLILSLSAAVIMAIGMGIANAAVFKLVPTYVPEAVGGAAGWVGGLGAFGGFVIPPVMGYIADQMGIIGYVRGFMVFIILSLLCLGVVYVLHSKKAEVATAELN